MARAGGITALNKSTPLAPMTTTPYMTNVPPKANQAKQMGSASFLLKLDQKGKKG